MLLKYIQYKGVMLSVCCILLGLITGSLPLRIKDVTVPNWVPMNESAELRCKYELEGDSPEGMVVKWWHWSETDPDNRTQLYQRIEGDYPVLVHKTPTLSILKDELDTLVLLRAQPQDSGVYQCEVSVKSALNEDRQSKPLYVYSKGTGPNINVSTTDENELLVECDVQDASPEPELKITMNGDVVNVSTGFIEVDAEGTWDLDVSTIVDPADFDSIVFTCELLYKQSKLIHPVYIVEYTYTRNDGVSTTEADEYWTSTSVDAPEQNNVTADETGAGDGCTRLEITALLPAVLVILQIIYSLQNTL